jgi:hypothetical protein
LAILFLTVFSTISCLPRCSVEGLIQGLDAPRIEPRLASIDKRAHVSEELQGPSQLLFVPCLYEMCQMNYKLRPHTAIVHQPHAYLTPWPVYTLVLWMQSRILPWSSRVSPESQMPSFESSLSEERMQERHQFYNECATPPRIQRFTGVDGELANEYVLFSNGTFNLIV